MLIVAIEKERQKYSREKHIDTLGFCIWDWTLLQILQFRGILIEYSLN